MPAKSDSQPTRVEIVEPNTSELPDLEGTIAVFVGEDGSLDPLARRVDRLTKGSLFRLAQSDGFQKAEPGKATVIAYPSGMAAERVVAVKLGRRARAIDARRAGAAIAASSAGDSTKILAGTHSRAAEVTYGYLLRDYSYEAMKSKQDETERSLTVAVSKPDLLEASMAPLSALVEGVFLTRDLVNAPANHLTTQAFADRISDMSEAGLSIEILDEAKMAELGMGALLGVGQGSETPSFIGIMRWEGGGDEKPLALVGKGVVFDTGGISIKPAGGMEDMTMDMGGAGVVCGTMLALAKRKAKANVVGVVGLVENMPDGRAQRPGDVVTSMKGDTIEVINTDAEGRLVLADAMWYTQDRFQPCAIIDLATLTGAAIIALGHENAAVFSNDDTFAANLLKAADAEGEGAWRMPLGKGYAKLLKSRIADVKNVGGRPAGASTAAEFLHRFVKEDLPWIHLDIAGVASQTGQMDPMAPKGATGWGVRTLSRLIADEFEE